MPESVSEEIKKSIVDQLYWDDSVDASHVMVEVTDGVVKLTGTVPSEAARRAAQVDALLVPGVQSVDNHLEVKLPIALPLPDDELAERVKKVLEWNADIGSSRDIRVSVNGGWVTLEGTVETYWKKLRAEELISTLSGVLGVTNGLAVVPTENLVDKAIASDIITALERNANIDVRMIDVEVDKGVVTISGTAPNGTAMRDALNAAKFAAGVLDVKNELTIA